MPYICKYCNKWLRGTGSLHHKICNDPQKCINSQHGCHDVGDHHCNFNPCQNRIYGCYQIGQHNCDIHPCKYKLYGCKQMGYHKCNFYKNESSTDQIC